MLKIFYKNKYTFLSLAIFILIWQGLGTFHLMQKVFISSPWEVLRDGSKMLFSFDFINNLEASLYVLVIGYILAVFFGVVLGFCSSYNNFWKDFLKPYMFGLNTIPVVALLPLIIIWFGIGYWSKIFTVFLMTLPTIWISTVSGIKSVDSNLLKMTKLFEIRKWNVIKDVYFKGALPYIFSGLKIGAGRSILGLVVAELFGYGKGLGYLVSYYGSLMQTSKLIFVIIFLLFLNFIIVKTLLLLEKKYIFWKI